MNANFHFHGTNADNLPSILENGFQGLKHDQVWQVSAGFNYFWDTREVTRAEQLESIKEGFHQARNFAKESAEVSLLNAEDCRRVVFMVDLTGVEKFKDNSCENMDEAIYTMEDISPERIKQIYIDENDLSMYKPYFYANIKDTNLLNFHCDDYVTKTIGESLNLEARLCLYESLSDIELVEFNV